MGLQKNGFFKQSGARAGLSYGLAEAQGPKTSELMAPDTSGLENSKTCSACGKIKSRVDFGKKQWAARAVRRCVACVESWVKVVFCDHGRGRDCAVCDAAAAASAAAAATAHRDPPRQQRRSTATPRRGTSPRGAPSRRSRTGRRRPRRSRSRRASTRPTSERPLTRIIPSSCVHKSPPQSSRPHTTPFPHLNL